MRISDWSSDVCSSDLLALRAGEALVDDLGGLVDEDCHGSVFSYFAARATAVSAASTIVDAIWSFSDRWGSRIERPSSALVPSRRITIGTPMSTRPMAVMRSEEHTSELQSLMRISYAVFCL